MLGECGSSTYIMAKIITSTPSTSILTGNPPVQQSVALESYMNLEEIKMQPAQTPITKPKHNLPLNERKATYEQMT